MTLAKFNHISFVKLFLLTTIIATAGIGGAFLIVPSTIPDIFSEVYIKAEVAFYLRFFGVVILGYSYLNVSALLNFDNKNLLKLVCQINILSLGLSMVISLIGLNQGFLVNYSFLFIAEHLFFLSGFIYIYTNH